MANVLKEQIIDKGKQLLLFEVGIAKPSKGRLDSVYYMKETSTSYIWDFDTDTYVQLSNNANDLLFYDKFVNFPVPTSEKEDSLYIANDISYIYKYNTLTLKYEYVKDVSSIAIQQVVPLKVKYSVPSVVPWNSIEIGDIYETGFDNKLYIHNSDNKFYLDLYLLCLYFLPADNSSWSDHIDPSLIPSDPTLNPDIVDKHTLEMLRAMFDNNSNNIVDSAENSNTLQGRTAQYFLNYTDAQISKVINETLGNKVRILEPEW